MARQGDKSARSARGKNLAIALAALAAVVVALFGKDTNQWDAAVEAVRTHQSRYLLAALTIFLVLWKLPDTIRAVGDIRNERYSLETRRREGLERLREKHRRRPRKDDD